MTTREAAAAAGVSIEEIRAAVDRGDLRASRKRLSGDRLSIDPADLRAWLRPAVDDAIDRSARFSPGGMTREAFSRHRRR